MLYLRSLVGRARFLSDTPDMTLSNSSHNVYSSIAQEQIAITSLECYSRRIRYPTRHPDDHPPSSNSRTASRTPVRVQGLVCQVRYMQTMTRDDGSEDGNKSIVAECVQHGRSANKSFDECFYGFIGLQTEVWSL